MNHRLYLLISVGLLIASCIYATQNYLLWRDRPKTSDELLREAHKRQLEADIKEMRANAKTEDQRIYVSFVSRLSETQNMREALDEVRLKDGIDRYEAWLLAQAYAFSTFGACGIVNLPTKDGTTWHVPAGVGSTAIPVKILITQDGIITCKDQAASTAAALLASH